MELTEIEFDGKTGMTLKWLMDFRSGLLSSPNQELFDKVELLAERMSKLEDKQKPKQRMSVGGKPIGSTRKLG